MTIVARQTSLFDLPPASRPSDDMERHADFNADRTCRYSLSCRWAPGPLAAWLLTNPAKASSDRSDQTFLRVHHFARSWGHPGFIIVNPVPFIAPNMKDLWPWLESDLAETEIEANRAYIRKAGQDAAVHIVGFGSEFMARETFLVAGALDNFLPAGRRAYCLGASSSGAPLHPMARGRHRVPDDALPQPWDESPFYKTQADKNAAGSDAP